MSKYVIYARVSTKKQEANGMSLETQIDQCRRYIQAQDGEVVGEFQDVMSGACRQRPGLIEALATAKANEATVVFATLSRLARDAEYAFTIKNSGVPLFFLDQPSCNDLVFGIMVSVYEEERRSRRVNTQAAQDYRKELIRKNGSFISKAGNIITKLGNPDPTYALEVAQVAAAAKKLADRVNDERWMTARKLAEDQREKGETLQSIAGTLNTIGITTRAGKTWTPTKVSKMLNQRIK